MKPIEEKLTPEKDYRELFTLHVDSNKCTADIIGIKNDGEYLYISEKLASSGNAYWMDRIFYSLDEDEYKHYVEMAKQKFSEQ